jgi:phenylpropionate dioxygenase-like ring-hydroxylating dioxygenase large terminal subunit
VLYGRCAHRGALMSDGYVQGDDLICVYMAGIIA